MSKQKKSTKSIKSDIQVKILEYVKIDDSYYNYLVLELTGPDINYVVINTLRRVIMELVPTYAFDKTDIEITKNTSIFNNDYMRLRLSQFPIFGIDNQIETVKQSLNLEYDSNISTFDQKIEDINIIAEKEQADKLEKAQNFIMNISVKNTTPLILNVTTAHPDIKFYYKTIPILSPYKRPLLIIKLKPGEEFNSTLMSTLNIGLKNVIYMPVAACSFSEVSENNFKFNLESLKQLTEKEIIIRACEIIIIKLNNFLNIFIKKIQEYSNNIQKDDYNLENKIIDKSSSETITESAIRNTSENVLEQHRIEGLITVENESHTFGNLIAKLLQDHKSILFAGYKIDHLLVKELTIGYKTDGTDIIVIFDDIFNRAIDIFEQIKTKVGVI